MNKIGFVDAHTEGEPTRIIVDGGPDIGNGTLQQRVACFAEHADDFRQCVIQEPRGWDAVVGALLCEPTDPNCAAGVIFFNNIGYLGMCGHGAVGVAVALHYLGKIGLGKNRLETPVGTIEIDLLSPNQAAIQNVPSYRLHHNVQIDVDGIGTVVGDVAWGGNWFFLIGESPADLILDNVDALRSAAGRVRNALRSNGITGANGAEIDHVEFFGPPHAADADSRNFVYCPGGQYDRSPCGTGTSAKLACLAADGKLQPGENWIQESIIGSRFTANYVRIDEHNVVPTIVGNAYICSEGNLIRQPLDPFANGIGCMTANESTEGLV
ncbi:proline racemase [Rhodopirellula maiorica SM1]|uniref:Proline racemase n=1 Tax=Rhodopirellula maiorica SM1 TaxID=1265738 RepID=M5S4R8_9BACT|nr:proline racemase family protein [Rhodopirellula maiorica]EMI22637.1 proline racemase [Rhodopirellula maiorica SM1]